MFAKIDSCDGFHTKLAFMGEIGITGEDKLTMRIIHGR